MCLILCGILVWFLADARQLRLEAAKALTLCAGTVIPALFRFMVITGLLVRLGFGQWLAPDMAGLMASLFRLPGCAGSALLLGLVGGYPIGARTAAELYASGDLTRQEAERLLTFCNNSNPVFLISVLGAGVFGSIRAGLWLWLIHVCAALLTGLLFRGLGRGRKTVPPAISFQAPSLPAAFVSSVRDSAGTMLSVCAFVTFFYVLISPLTALPGPWAALAVGCGELFSLTPLLSCDRTGFLLAAGCAGWGGLSVLCQTAALDGTDLPPRPLSAGQADPRPAVRAAGRPRFSLAVLTFFNRFSGQKARQNGASVWKTGARYFGEVMYEKIYQHAACLRRDRWSAGLGLLPGGQWAVGVYLKEWLFLSDQRRGRETALSRLLMYAVYTPNLKGR
ncbi:MAG: sporulation protein [Dysosmobacter sp.]